MAPRDRPRARKGKETDIKLDTFCRQYEDEGEGDSCTATGRSIQVVERQEGMGPQKERTNESSPSSSSDGVIVAVLVFVGFGRSLERIKHQVVKASTEHERG